MHGYLDTDTNTNINVNTYSNTKSYSHTATSPKSAASPDALPVTRTRCRALAGNSPIQVFFRLCLTENITRVGFAPARAGKAMRVCGC